MNVDISKYLEKPYVNANFFLGATNLRILEIILRQQFLLLCLLEIIMKYRNMNKSN